MTMPDLLFNESEHRYFLGKLELLSVTKVLDDAGLTNLDGPQVDIERARERGRSVHLACHLYDLNRLREEGTHPDVMAYVRAYAAMRKDTGFVPIHSEYMVHNPDLLVAGTLDKWGQIDGRKVLLDLKATAAIPRTVGIQTAAYKFLAGGKQYGLDTDRRAVVQLVPGSTPPYKYRDLDSVAPYNQDLQLFLSALAIARWKHKHYGRGS